MDGLYHCTTYDSLMRILQSGAFYPSYCLEQASYLKWNPNFAFAMVCFAGILSISIYYTYHFRKNRSFSQCGIYSPKPQYSYKVPLSNFTP